MYFKQVPANLGNFVVINDDASGAGNGYVWVYSTSNNGKTPALETTGVVSAPSKSSDSSNGKGTVYRDLGVTYVEKLAANKSMCNVYRKVVRASDAASLVDPTEVFIKVVNANKPSGDSTGSSTGSVQFARLG